jgi:hypothetical protein
MTRDEILNMPAGPNMDAIVAESLGWHIDGEEGEAWCKNADTLTGVTFCAMVDEWAPSTEGTDALRTVDEITEDGLTGFTLSKESPPAPLEWEATFQDDNLHGGYADKAPLAICRAILMMKVLT